jgi:hypothetical protein
MKAKTAIWIALGRRFAHSLRLFHGKPNSSKIVFDEYHRIQITDFELIDLEMHDRESESESVTRSGVGEDWTGEANVRAFLHF